MHICKAYQERDACNVGSPRYFLIQYGGKYNNSYHLYMQKFRRIKKTLDIIDNIRILCHETQLNKPISSKHWKWAISRALTIERFSKKLFYSEAFATVSLTGYQQWPIELFYYNSSSDWNGLHFHTGPFWQPKGPIHQFLPRCYSSCRRQEQPIGVPFTLVVRNRWRKRLNSYS